MANHHSIQLVLSGVIIPLGKISSSKPHFGISTILHYLIDIETKVKKG